MVSLAYPTMESQALHPLRKISLRMTFGEKLRQARVKAGLSQQDIANLFEPALSRNAVANWELNNNLPDADRLKVLARAVRLSVDDLLSSRPLGVAEPATDYAVSPEADPGQLELLKDYSTATPSWQLVLRLLAKLPAAKQPMVSALINRTLGQGAPQPEFSTLRRTNPRAKGRRKKRT